MAKQTKKIKRNPFPYAPQAGPQTDFMATGPEIPLVFYGGKC